MQALYVVGMIDAEYNVEFNSADLKSCTTIVEIFGIVQSRIK
jgi:acyl carrier protein